ncbi:Peptidyl-prolyl cis-trans isomerase pin1 [Nosema granulosis]|uniref:Peptidyl-prolyl cis-trans isomerase n=1 Tax=Nosema granulosis TaxID=83296 RepID=A0A9P6GYT5_9MICR|nr:Peptidyl-prolyl cis-trans isomerase pin1 [Nosema granulosis]
MWVRCKDTSTNKYFYYNEETKERSETKPKEGLRIYHILIKHRGSRKPVDRSENEALEKALEIYEDCKKKLDQKNFREYFKERALNESECSSSKRGGDLGFVVKNEMVKEFEKACFLLKRGSIVGPVKTESGYHIIYRR